MAARRRIPPKAPRQPSAVEDLARDPIGRFVVGPTFVHFCAAPQLWGVILWGRPDATHARQLGQSLVLELAPPAVPHASIVDASRLEGGDDGAFGALERYMTRYAEALRLWVTKLAVVRPPGLRGAIVAGAYEVVTKPYPVSVFDDAALALRWLGASLGPEDLDELYAAATRSPPILNELRSLLAKSLRGLTLADAARALHVSERTLQRKLTDAETTFQDEMADARVTSAKRMLVEGEASLTTIALESGCASLQHFNTLFRKRTGVAPSVWRSKARRGV